MRKVTFGINITLDGYCGHESAVAVIRVSRSFAYTQVIDDVSWLNVLIHQHS